MTTHIFELSECTPANLDAVRDSLASIPGCKIYSTAMGAYLLRVEADPAPDAQVEKFLAPLHVKPIRAVEVTEIVLSR